MARPMPFPGVSAAHIARHLHEGGIMQLIRTLRRSSVLSLLASLVFGFLTACGGSDARIDEQLRADLAAAAQAPGARGQFASPAELGYGQGYAPNYSPGAQAYGPQPYPPLYGCGPYAWAPGE